MRSHKKQDGITLIETIIALAILSFGLVALIKLQSYVINHSAISKQQMEAVNIAEMKIEAMRDYSQISTATGTKAYNDISSGTQSITSTTSIYTVAWVVNESTNQDRKVIDVVVSWVDSNGANQSMNLTSVISKLDPARGGAVMGASGGGILQP